MTGRCGAALVPLVCAGPFINRGHDAIARDTANLTAALNNSPTGGLPARDRPEWPRVPGRKLRGGQRVLPSYQEYLFAVADALHDEYQAIVDAGFLLQIDDPFLTDISAPGARSHRRSSARSCTSRRSTGRCGIPPERVRFHTCYGINEGPRIHDAALAEVCVDAQGPRDGPIVRGRERAPRARIPRVGDGEAARGRLLIPGVITHASNIVEHPELIAERLIAPAPGSSAART